ncbi:MAG: hypothetical protein ABSF44_12880 [Candidatus Bathyarchaeia archaeon]
MTRKINWIGLAAGIITLIALAISLYMPWWQLTVGQSLIKINASPVNTNFGLFGTQFTIPLIWALNLVTILTFSASGIIMLIYSLVPTKPYAKHLLGFSYKKPLYSVVSFVVVLAIILLIAGHFGVYLPLNGSATVTLPGSWTMGATVSALVSGTFQLPFYLAVVATALCITARLYHSHVSSALSESESTTTPPVTAATSV